MNAPKITILPLNLFWKAPVSKAAEKLETDMAIVIVRKALNAWMYAS